MDCADRKGVQVVMNDIDSLQRKLRILELKLDSVLNQLSKNDVQATQPNVISDATLDEPCVLTFSGLMTFTPRDVMTAFGVTVPCVNDPVSEISGILEANFGNDPRRLLGAIITNMQWPQQARRDYCEVEFLTLDAYTNLSGASIVYVDR